jgi:hypothetical protein
MQDHRAGRAWVVVIATWTLPACGARTELHVDPIDTTTDLVALSCPTDPNDARLSPIGQGQSARIDGSQFVTGSVATWSWSVVNEDCDAVVKRQSYSLEPRDQAVVTFRPGRPTSYVLRLHVTDASGDEAECQFEVPVVGRGLRVELCWDTSTTTDLDLYLHRPFNTSDWFTFSSGGLAYAMTGDTCNPANCPADLRFGYPRVDWGYPDSPMEWCDAGPSAADFRRLGRCPNPRAGIDNNQNLITGTSEVIQIDVPEAAPYRVMAQNFSNTPASPQAFVYCAGRPAGSFAPPSRPPNFVANPEGVYGTMWRVADITPTLDAGGAMTGCSAEPIPEAEGVTIDDPRY